MTNNAVVIPVAILCSLCVAMFAFICWWFPRTYKKGVEEDMYEVDVAVREMEIANENRPAGAPAIVMQPKLTYIPPVAGY